MTLQKVVQLTQVMTTTMSETDTKGQRIESSPPTVYEGETVEEDGGGSQTKVPQDTHSFPCSHCLH